MSFTEKYSLWFRRLFPSPFSIAIILTIITLIASLVVSDKSIPDLLLNWQTGLWQSNLLAFAFQMMLMLVLGHALALSSFFDRVISLLTKPLKNTAQAAAFITFTTIIIAFLNWGLGLIFGAIFARKVGEHFTKMQYKLNYALIGAAGYVGLMAWHGGLSGSSLTKVAEKNHIREMANNIGLPEAISYSDTVFSSLNLTAFALLLVVLPIAFYFIGKRSEGSIPSIQSPQIEKDKPINLIGAEKIDQLALLSKAIGAGMIGLAIYIGVAYQGIPLGYINPNYINFWLLGLCLLLHKNFSQFLIAVNDAIIGSAGILIQFPLYFGILALMQSSGLIVLISNWFTAISNQTTLPILTFFSAGLVNVFVPSGGGQWAIQGPIILEAASKIGVPLNKMILALAYGDQLTNMLQPFWALPLLSITGLKAKDILPYTLLLMVLGALIFILCLLIF